MSTQELKATRASAEQVSASASRHEHSHAEEPALREIPLRFSNLSRITLLAMIRLYQLTLSRAVPQGTCRFYPTCSQYGYQAIAKHGAIKGTGLAVWRVLRCQPFAKGGYDPVP